jgi:MFS family permease
MSLAERAARAGELPLAARPGGARLGQLALIGLPGFAFSLAVTIVAAFLPLVISELVGPLLTGLLIGVEGLFALVVPPLVGAWSDRTQSRLGPRLPFLLASGPLVAIALVLLPLAGSIAALAGALACFFATYFPYLTPHGALIADVVPAAMRGRAMSALGLWREVGLGAGLVVGPLLTVSRILPFLVAAAVVLAVTLALVIGLRKAAPATAPARALGGVGGATRRELAALPAVKAALAANALWETALSALRAFALLLSSRGSATRWAPRRSRWAPWRARRSSPPRSPACSPTASGTDGCSPRRSGSTASASPCPR